MCSYVSLKRIKPLSNSVAMICENNTWTWTHYFQQGEVSDNTDLLEWWMERDNVLPRLNSKILATTKLRLDMTGGASNKPLDSVLN